MDSAKLIVPRWKRAAFRNAIERLRFTGYQVTIEEEPGVVASVFRVYGDESAINAMRYGYATAR
jgi:hypothetical protein